ncbi:MAG: hypothetical protein AB1938_18375 [Myxococcota bacterium]
MRTRFVRALLAVLAVGALTACPPAEPPECIEGDEPSCDGGLPPDFCDSKEEALADSEHCHLTVGTMPGQDVRKMDLFISTLGDGGIDKDFYFAQMPGTLTARSLLHINGGYSAPQTAVDFSINVLQDLADGGTTSIVSGADRHGAAAPKPVDIIIPFAEANAKLFLLVGHEQLTSQVKVDNRNPYSMLVEVLDNPDTNEPNDTTPTVINLAAGGGGQQGTQSGYLATTDDVDQFTFPMSLGGRQIIYLRITGPNPHPTNPPPPFRLGYTLYDPSNNPISEGQVDNEFQQIDLSTARLAAAMGNYTLKITAYRPPNMPGSVKGDLRIKYDVEVRILPDVDATEPNDTLATARTITMAPNSGQSITGKLSTVPDEEWFRFSLPARASPSVLRWEMSVASGGGRFPPLAPTATRQVRFLRQVTQGATAQDRQNACITDPVACPKGYDDPQSDPALLVEAVCKTADPPHCLYAQRNEHPDYDNLKNLVGALPIPANQAVEFYMLVRDEGAGRIKYADDRDWTVNVRWDDDADEAMRQSGPTVSTLGGSTSEVSGALTYGYGRMLNFDFDRRIGSGIRGPEDYDAFDTDKDLFQFNLSGAADLSWQLEWIIDHGDAGSPPGDVVFEFTFCGSGAAGDGGLCGGSQTRIFAFSTDPQTPWYTPPTLPYVATLISRQNQGNSTVLTVTPIACQCLSAPRVAAGRFFANLGVVDRTRNDPLVYRLRQSVGAYPSTYTGDGGATVSCPSGDGGCGFAR